MKIDRQRYKKVYPVFRRPPHNEYTIEGIVNIENKTVSFSNNDTITYTFETIFRNVPTVTISPLGDPADILIYIQSVTRTQVIIKASIANNYSVNIHAIEALT